jgi:hypothetical protein
VERRVLGGERVGGAHGEHPKPTRDFAVYLIAGLIVGSLVRLSLAWIAGTLILTVPLAVNRYKRT